MTRTIGSKCAGWSCPCCNRNKWDRGSMKARESREWLAEFEHETTSRPETGEQ